MSRGAGRKPIIKLEAGWAELNESIKELIDMCENDFASTMDTKKVMANYSKVYNMAVQRPPNNFCDELYKRYKEVFVTYLNGTVLPHLRAKGGQFMLEEVGKRWSNHRDVMVKWMKKFFLYLDQYYTRREKLPNIYDTGMEVFRDTMFPMVKNDLTTAIINMVTQEREGEPIDRGLLKSVVELFVEMGLGSMDTYRNGFETGFLASSASYYTRLAEGIVLEPLPVYLKRCAEQLQLEKTRVANYLHKETEEKLVKELKKEMLEVHQEQILTQSNGLVTIFGASLPFAEASREDVSVLYGLFKDLPTGLTDPRLEGTKYGKQAICDMMKEHIIKLGTDEVKAQQAKEDSGEEEGGKDFISSLVDIHKHFVDVFEKCCEGDKDFHAALKEAYEDHIINDDSMSQHFIPKLLSEYCDFFLRKETGKGVDVEEATACLDSAVKIYTYIKDKDFFNQYYKRALANRLLHDSTIGLDQESQFITKIKQACGAGQTRHLESMINDIQTSTQTHGEGFNKFRDENAEMCAAFKKTKEVTVNLCNLRVWPEFRVEKLTPHAEMDKIMTAFSAYYASIQKGGSGDIKSELSWVFSYGNAQVHPVYGGIKSGFGHKMFAKFKMNLDNPYQLAVLLLFNQKDKWATDEMCAALDIDAVKAEKYCDSLSKGRFKAIKAKCHVEGVDSKAATFAQLTFEVNKNLPKESVDKRRKRPLPKIEFPMGKEDATKARAGVDMAVQEERKFAIDAAVVRAMKMNKKMQIAMLIPHVCRELAYLFQAYPKFVRARIEDLIDKGFMERVDGDPRSLQYLA